MLGNRMMMGAAGVGWDGVWDLLAEDCGTFPGGWTDNDQGDAVTSVSPAGQFYFDANTGYCDIYRDFGSTPNEFTVELKLYHDDIGALAAGDTFVLFIEQADERLFISWASDGLFVYDTDSGQTEVGTNLVKEGVAAEWQIWRFVVTFTGTVGEATCDVYLTDTTHTDEKVGTAIPCSQEGARTDGKIEFYQQTDTTNNLSTHMDYVYIATGLHAP